MLIPCTGLVSSYGKKTNNESNKGKPVRLLRHFDMEYANCA